MKLILKMHLLLSLGCFLLAGSIHAAGVQADKVRAKIGIQVKSGDRIKRAKSREHLKVGDLLRIYVHPEKVSHIYLVHTDLNKATLLNMVHQKIRSSTLVMPSLQEFYRIDGSSARETITIIVSPDELPEAVNVLTAGNAPYAKWLEVEKELQKKSRIDLSEQIAKPFSISGNVRGGAGSRNIDPFVKKLQIFTGKSILVRHYEFRVKK